MFAPVPQDCRWRRRTSALILEAKTQKYQALIKHHDAILAVEEPAQAKVREAKLPPADDARAAT